MFLTRRALKEKVISLEYRIAELEERLCPCKQHDMVATGSKFISDGYDGGIYVKNYTCKRCGKVIEEYNWKENEE